MMARAIPLRRADDVTKTRFASAIVSLRRRIAPQPTATPS
jgi:hypothetical protein